MENSKTVSRILNLLDELIRLVDQAKIEAYEKLKESGSRREKERWVNYSFAADTLKCIKEILEE